MWSGRDRYSSPHVSAVTCHCSNGSCSVAVLEEKPRSGMPENTQLERGKRPDFSQVSSTCLLQFTGKLPTV
ncbi:hypothetical protein RRG08_012357 [Elysia crispata]|uniref:Uncharacterized protein n=1 Tax=Elysia crispata TaxID=231223 RepID=A0AAE1AC66_9GAST|nr:hypothetical protein RRG08_012357 [Elysia crispata]